MNAKVTMQFERTNELLVFAYENAEKPSIEIAYQMITKSRDNMFRCICCTICVYCDEGTVSEQYQVWMNRDGSYGGKTITYCKF